MRVLHLLASTGFYGAEGVVAQLFAPLAELGCDVSLGLFAAAQQPHHGLIVQARAHGVAVLDIPCRGRFDLSALRTLRTQLRERQIDVLHTHSYKANFYGLLAARLCGVPILTTCHNWTNRTLALRLYAHLDKRMLRRFDRVITVSESIAAILREGGFPAARLRVIANGIDTRRFSHAPRTANQLMPDQPITIGAVSRLSEEKGIDLLVRAVAQLHTRWPALRCVIAGEGPERAALLSLSKQLGVADQIKVPGFCSDIPSFLESCDVLVQPSRNEAMPLAVLEAMAAGKPIVATAVGDVPRLIQDGYSGVLVPSEDAPALARGIERLLSDEVLRHTTGHAARQYVERHCDVRVTAARYMEQYAEVTGAGMPIAVATP